MKTFPMVCCGEGLLTCKGHHTVMENQEPNPVFKDLQDAFKKHQRQVKAYRKKIDEDLNDAVQSDPVCTICGVNWVNTDEGYDTCKECLSKM